MKNIGMYDSVSGVGSQGVGMGDMSQKSLASRGAIDRYVFPRYRCVICGNDFCDTCMASPYHLGLTCEEHAAPRCTLCRETPLPEFTHSVAQARSLQTKDLNRAILVIPPNTLGLNQREREREREPAVFFSAPFCTSPIPVSPDLKIAKFLF